MANAKEQNKLSCVLCVAMEAKVGLLRDRIEKNIDSFELLIWRRLLTIAWTAKKDHQTYQPRVGHKQPAFNGL